MHRFTKLIAFALILIAFAFAIVIVTLIPGRADFTEEKFFTLSDGSRAMLANMENSVRLDFYVSREAEGLPVTFKNYVDQVEDLLREYSQAADGRIRLFVNEVRPDTEVEEEAVRSGAVGQQLPSGESVYFGIVASQADQQEAIPFIDPNRRAFLEYDVSRLVYEVSLLNLPKVGILSSLPVVGSPQPMMMPGQPPQGQDWAFVEDIRRRFEIIEITGATIAEDIDVLAVIHPKDLSEAQLFSIDQFLLSGRPVFVAVDPSSYYERASQQQSPMMQPPPPSSSDLRRLFERYGISVTTDQVLADLEYGAELRSQTGTERYPQFIFTQSINETAVPTAQLGSLLLPLPGSIAVDDERGYEVDILLETSTQAGFVEPSMLDFMPPDRIARDLEVAEEAFAMAVLVRGTFATAFPNGDPMAPPPAEGEGSETVDTASDSLTESVGPTSLVVVADTDFLVDDFSVQRMNLFGQTMIRPINDNLAFVANTLEFLAGSEDLIQIRGRQASDRSFSRVRDLELAAEAEFREAVEEVENQQRQVQEQIQALQAQTQDLGQLVASPEIQESLEELREQEVTLRRELRELRRGLREDIEGLDRTAAFLNIVPIPLLIVAGGVVLFFRRSNRQRR